MVDDNADSTESQISLEPQNDPEDESPISMKMRITLFFSAHWRGFVCILTPLILLPTVVPFPGEKHQWTAYTLMLMAVFWVTECIPLAITAFLPVLIFPMTNVMSTTDTCKNYINSIIYQPCIDDKIIAMQDVKASAVSAIQQHSGILVLLFIRKQDTVIMFIGSIMLAYAVEQSGLHKRLAYFVIKTIGFSHYKLLLAMCIVTTFVSMWITNTAATTMMIPINFALLKVFEDQKILNIYDITPEGNNVASDISTCYFCAATFSATIGGIGTLVGTGTNLVFKGLFQSSYPNAPEYLSFPLFSAFAVPYMIVMEACMYFYMIIVYFGFLRPDSAVAKAAVITTEAKEAAANVIDNDLKDMGKLSFWEAMVIILFGGAMVLFFCRSPQIFTGWGDKISDHFIKNNSKFVRDSALAMLVAFLMLLLPSSLMIFKNFTAKVYGDLPDKPVPTVLIWRTMDDTMPYSFMFLLGGGFALSAAAKSSGLNDRLGIFLQSLNILPNSFVLLVIIIVVVFITNFASNVAVANVVAPIAMELAKQINQNPLWYCIASGFSASYCFMIPVGTPGNLIAQCAVNMPTGKMIKAGLGPTISTILITWFALMFWAPVIWPDLHTLPVWIEEYEAVA